MKQSFKIQEGCTCVTIEQVCNQIIATFEPNEFKSGDILISRSGIVFIYRKVDGVYAYYYFMHDTDSIISDNFLNSCCAGCIADSRLATPEEAQRLWDALAKKGKRWNPEMMQVEEIEKLWWRAKFDEAYYFIEFDTCSVSESRETKHRYDNARHVFGNYFRTQEQAQRAADKLKQDLAEFWKEELK